MRWLVAESWTLNCRLQSDAQTYHSIDTDDWSCNDDASQESVSFISSCWWLISSWDFLSLRS